MPIYPVIPITQFYNNAVTYDPRAAKVELGKGGVLDRSRIHFFNNTRKSYSISAVLKDRDTLQNFLELNRGKPFEFRYDGSNSAGLYICKTWSWDWVVYVDGVSGVWNFSATFEQVFRPGWVSDTTGLGTLQVSSFDLVGLGSIDIRTLGTGNLLLPLTILSGTGVVFQSTQGIGSLTLSDLQITGAGKLGLRSQGTIFLPTLELSGTGSIRLTQTGNGNLFTSDLSTTGIGVIRNIGSGEFLTNSISITGTGVTLAPGASNTRITEAGNIRTTEAGNTRTTEAG